MLDPVHYRAFILSLPLLSDDSPRTAQDTDSAVGAGLTQQIAAAVMRTLATLVVLWLVSPAQAASMHVINENGKQGIYIEGLIATGDDNEFSHALEGVRDKYNSLVFTSGWGGNGLTGVLIGDIVRRSGISTVVLEGNDCASACAMIWVAGARRIAGKNACIGFHGMYDPASGQPIADGNAIAGGHLGLLGLSLDAIFWMLAPRQLDVHWLTDETAEKYGIHWVHEKDDPGHSCPNQRSEASGNEDRPARRQTAAAMNITTSCTPQAPEGSDPITRISVFVSHRDDATFINVIHYSLRGNAYERAKQYNVYTRGLNDGSWQWLGQRLTDANTWMVGELNPMGSGSYRYREWLYHADPENHRFR